MPRVAILGAGGGIGQACVHAFAEAGWEIAAGDVDDAAADAALAGAPGFAAAVNVTDPDTVAHFAERAEATAMVYAAGINATMPITDTDFDVWRKVMAVNLDGAAIAAAAFARCMIAAGSGGSMVFLSSTAGLRGEAGASAYCASKFGLVGLVQSVAAELTAHDIRVNAVAPGNVDTPMLRAVARDIAQAEGSDPEAVWQGLATAGAACRLVRPDEVARLCLALSAPGLGALTGATVPLDAGSMLL